MIRGLIHQEDTTIINICAPAIRAPKYIKQISISERRNRQQYNNSRRFIPHPQQWICSSKQKINRETLDLNYTFNQMDPTDIQNIPSNSSRTYILPKHAWSILQDKS